MAPKQCLILLITGLINLSLSETQLKDEIGDMICEPKGNPYIIEREVIIPKNSKLTIKAGCVFLFKSFTRLNVYGSLLVEGTVENPVVFTSVNDSKYNPDAQQLPKAFDWQGINVSDESKDVKLQNFELKYSIYGIKSKKEKITIQNGIFKQNGQFDFTINNNVMSVQDKISYDYKSEFSKKNKIEKRKGEETGTEENEIIKTAAKSPGEVMDKRRITGIAVSAFGILNSALSLGTGIASYHYSNKMKDTDSEINNPSVNSGIKRIEEDWDSYNKKHKRTVATSIITGTLFGVSIPIALYLFLKSEKNTEIKPVSLDILGNSHYYYFGFTYFF